MTKFEVRAKTNKKKKYDGKRKLCENGRKLPKVKSSASPQKHLTRNRREAVIFISVSLTLLPPSLPHYFARKSKVCVCMRFCIIRTQNRLG